MGFAIVNEIHHVEVGFGVLVRALNDAHLGSNGLDDTDHAGFEEDDGVVTAATVVGFHSDLAGDGIADL